MQAISILNLLVPTAGGQASPLNLLGAEGTNNANGIFSLPEEGEGLLAFANIDTSLEDSLNPENGGIVPVPLVSGAANPVNELESKLAYLRQRDGRVPTDIISNLSGNNVLSDEQVLPSQNSINPALANDINNDADIQLYKPELLAATTTTQPKPEGFNVNAVKPEQLPAETIEKLKAMAVENAKNKEAVIADQDKAELEVKTLNDKASAEKSAFLDGNKAPVTNANFLHQLNEQVSKEASQSKLSEIDSNEPIIETSKFKELQHSRLEAQVRVSDNLQMNQTPAEQVKVNISKALIGGVREIQINLHPAELGKLDVKMEVSDEGESKVRIVADRNETLDLLRRDAGDLNKALKDLGIETGDSGLEFSLNENAEQGTEFGNSSNGQQEDDGEYLDLKPINEYQKYGSLDNQELILNIKQEGLNLVA